MKPSPRGAKWRIRELPDPGDGPARDPYLEWLRATGFAHYGTQVEWLPLLVQLRDTNAEAFAQSVLQLQGQGDGGPDWAKQMQVAPFFATRPKRLRGETHFVSLLMTRQLLEQVYAGKQPELASQLRRIDIGRPGPPGAPTAISLSGPFKPSAGQTKPELVIAVIDDAIAFAHDRLRSSDGTTRVEYLWQQPNIVGWPPGQGREFSKTEPSVGLDDLTRTATHNGRVDEDEVYRLAGLTNPALAGHQPLAARFAHGAHVADLACCDGPPPPPRQRPIIGVQLPADVVADTSGASLRPQVFFGLFYALYRAETIAQSFGGSSLSLLVNISYGLSAGPHDGSDMLEAAIDQLLAACDPAQARLRVLLPAGNIHLSRCHACFDLAAGGEQPLPWRLLPDDATPGSLQVRLPRAAYGVHIIVTLPNGSVSPALKPGTVTEVGPQNEARCVVFFPQVSSLTRTMVTIFVSPTAAVAGGVPLAPPGRWLITLHNTCSLPIAGIHAWIQRDDITPGFPRRGRQSYFDDPAYACFDAGGRPIEDDPTPTVATSVVKRAGSHNALATGKRPLVVGAFRRNDGAASSYSAGGPLPPPGRGAPNPNGPEAMLPGDDSPSHPGVLGAGTRSSSCVAMNGTSVAAPLALRRLVRETVAGNTTDRQALLKLAADYEVSRVPPWPKPKPGLSRGGGGRLDEPSNRSPR